MGVPAVSQLKKIHRIDWIFEGKAFDLPLTGKKPTMPTETIFYLNPENTCPAQGLYSHATEVPASGKTLYIAGQLSVGLDGSVVGKNDFATQMHQVLDNLSSVLKGTGLGFNNILSIRRISRPS